MGAGSIDATRAVQLQVENAVGFALAAAERRLCGTQAPVTLSAVLCATADSLNEQGQLLATPAEQPGSEQPNEEAVTSTHEVKTLEEPKDVSTPRVHAATKEENDVEDTRKEVEEAKAKADYERKQQEAVEEAKTVELPEGSTWRRHGRSSSRCLSSPRLCAGFSSLPRARSCPPGRKGARATAASSQGSRGERGAAARSKWSYACPWGAILWMGSLEVILTYRRQLQLLPL